MYSAVEIKNITNPKLKNVYKVTAYNAVHMFGASPVISIK